MRQKLHDGRAIGVKIRNGIDVTDVATVRGALEEFGLRYTRRVYTDDEVAYCQDASSVEQTAERFAARFAAKEAVIKVLRPAAARPPWTSIEVVRHADGWCEVALSGSAARMASDAGIAELSISLSHEGGMAVASAVALMSEREVSA
jgi:holo-[acyl-carrier protein] synthase